MSIPLAFRPESQAQILHALGIKPEERLHPEAADPSIAVLLPCYNEAATIADVVAAFRDALPTARIYVYDNNSTDATRDQAASAGAIVRCEPIQGKGAVVRRMFADIDADVYVMADGDGTYDATMAPAMVSRLLDQKLDMVVGARLAEAGAFRHGHRWGNRVFNRIVARLFGRGFEDIFSGYRVFSRRFVKSFPALATGYEIETELTVHALQLRLPVSEVGTRYFPRPDGSTSKLRTVRDGLRILGTILLLLKQTRPFLLFGLFSAATALLSLALAVPVFGTWLSTGLVPRLPTAILCTGLMLLASLSLVCGLILDSVSRGQLELKRLRYLALNDGAAPT